MTRGRGALAAGLLLLASAARALRVVPGSLVVDEHEVYLTRTITVHAVLEDDKAAGMDGMDLALLPDPPQLVRAAGGEPPVRFTCSPVGGQSAGFWVFEAAAPGRVRFRLAASGVQCTTGEGQNLEALTDWVTLKPLPLWSNLVVSDRILAPGGVVSLTLTVRNDAAVEAACALPGASEDYRGRGVPLVAALGRGVVDPPDAVRGGRLLLTPGRRVSVAWRFRALAPGETRFQVIGAGLVVMSPEIAIRPAAALAVDLAPPAPSAVGREITVRARVHLAGDTAVRSPWAGLSWAPAAAARLTGGGLSSTGLLSPDHDAVAAAFTLELLAPGPLALTVSAGGREQDSGRDTGVAAATATVLVQAPAVLAVGLTTASATVLVGSRAAFTVRVANGSRAPTQGLSPIVSVKAGRVSLLPLSPLFQAVPAGGAASFAGALVADGEGPIELGAQATSRGDRGGAWVSASADPVRLLAVAPPRLEVFALNDRVAGGVTASVHFLLRNASPLAFALRTASVTLAGSPAGAIGQPRLRPLPLTLAPGASATMTVTAWLPADKKPYWVSGLLYLSGTITAYRLPCQVQVGSRPLALVAPRARGFAWTEPEGVFRPPLDPLLGMEWSLTAAGKAGLAVVAADGRVVRTLEPLQPRSAGFHTTYWDGLGDGGAPVPPGAYQLRLAGPVSATVPGGTWPGAAAWRDVLPLEVRQP